MKSERSIQIRQWALVGLLLTAAMMLGVYIGTVVANDRRTAAVETSETPNAAPHAKDTHGHTAHAEDHEACEAECEAEGDHVDEVTLTPQAIQQNQITIAQARKQALIETFVVPGRVSYNAEAMAHVGTPVGGRVVEIKARVGDIVRTGDELFVVDSPALGEAQSDFLQKQTQGRVAQSSVELAKAALERATRLLDAKGISFGEFQKREGELKTAEGALLSAQAALTAAENKLHLFGASQSDIAQLLATGEVSSRYVVRAPIAGTVVEREVTLGEIVSPDREALLVLADLTTLWVLADAPESLLHRIAIGSLAEATVGAIEGQPFEGKVTFVTSALDKATRTGQVRIEVPDGHTPLRPGMFARVRLTLAGPSGRKPEAVIAVPEAAVQIVEGGPAVFVEVDGEPNTFARQAVAVGPPVGRIVPVLSGLEEGRRFVSEGAFLLKAELAKGEMEGKTCSGH
ncbi:efflux RND transporter periplasmic adaptor subunit [Candidatus Sumerlaeota bacterium]|nr:efflux RND transporter periplasmic adaptor subunit [Candidatus Sumerlaeota bacterium]